MQLASQGSFRFAVHQQMQTRCMPESQGAHAQNSGLMLSSQLLHPWRGLTFICRQAPQPLCCVAKAVVQIRKRGQVHKHDCDTTGRRVKEIHECIALQPLYNLKAFMFAGRPSCGFTLARPTSQELPVDFHDLIYT